VGKQRTKTEEIKSYGWLGDFDEFVIFNYTVKGSTGKIFSACGQAINWKCIIIARNSTVYNYTGNTKAAKNDHQPDNLPIWRLKIGQAEFTIISTSQKTKCLTLEAIKSIYMIKKCERQPRANPIGQVTVRSLAPKLTRGKWAILFVEH